MGAALLVYPQAAYAAPSVSPPIVAVGGNVTINEDGTPFAGGSADRVQLLTTAGATCPSTYTTPTTAIVAAQATVSSTTSQVVFTMPTALTANASGQAKRYTACVYAAASPGVSLREGSATGYPVYVGIPPTVAPLVGLTGGGNRIDVTAGANGPIFTGVTTVGAVFVPAATECPATYGTPAAGTTTTGTRTSDTAANLIVPAGITSFTGLPTPYNLCLYNGNAGTSALISFTQYNVGQLSLSQTMGPWQGGNSINITSPNPFLAGIDAPGVLFKAGNTCPSTYVSGQSAGATEPLSADAIRKVSNSRLAVTAPAPFYTDQTAYNTAASTASNIPWQLCVYAGSQNASSALVASNAYRVTTIQSATAVTPKAGPALGGSLITVVGTAFPPEPGAITATLGGTPLTDITVLSPTAFTARTPTHAPANNVALVVTTAGGSHTLPNAFSYTSAVVANPKTAPNTRPVDVIVNGVGFESAPWNNNVELGAHIFLVQGNYSNASVSGVRANPPVADCRNVLVLSDSELVCKLDLTRRLNAAGTGILAGAPKYAVDVTTVTGSRVVTAAGSTFDSLDVGKAIVDPAASSPKIPAGTVITAVVNGTTAIMSNPASGVLTADDSVTIASTNNRITSFVTEVGTGLTGADLTAADVNKYVAAPDVPANTTLSSEGATTGVLSQAATSAHSGAPVQAVISSPNIAVPEGSYNLQYVSNAALNAVHTDATYVQSQVSSASTFTVSSF